MTWTGTMTSIGHERDFAVVVCCSDDFDVHHALESIDDPSAHVVVTMTPNPLLERYMHHRRIPFVLTERGNHAATTNAGVMLAASRSVLIIDSDTVLTPGTVRRVRCALESHDVVNLRIGFAAEDSALSRAIANLRDFDNTYDCPAYKPGIAFNLNLTQRIGGHLYDERVKWPCDAELMSRLRETSEPICHLREIGIVHRPIAMTHLVRAYFHYGVGDAQQMFAIGHRTHWWPLSNLLFRYVSAVRWARTRPSRGLIGLLLLVDVASLTGIVTEATRIWLRGRTD